MMNTYAERVAKGAALLDEKVPDWAAEINMDALDITSSTRCILGQLFGGFVSGLGPMFDDREIGWKVAPDYGFNLTQDEWDNRWDSDENVAEELLGGWFIEINNRLS